MTFYIASRLENAAQVSQVAAALVARGHVHTYDWTTHGSVQHCGTDRIREVAGLELRGVVDADVVIVLLPGGRGTHAELGIALGAGGKRIYICAEELGMFHADDRTCAFYWCPVVVRVVGSPESWVPWLAEVERHPVDRIAVEAAMQEGFVRVMSLTTDKEVG